MFKDDAMISVL